ncbi:CHASE3 domain-containing protein [Microvirga sp. STR05]|uniref:histidine kinase n=1 Tax=Hymenobacter duratus TaxID=2771356 RepID=A0ABR8JJL5_9BACT|nr:ATP-binding protein [Hymenobacter duratus]MBD2715816.1 CHASE3 domain-containing protein [Hymenobacter duratus]MBR7950727.1 CHASE3 domain-containing protein [Microvirga sp. STR05]
MRLRLNTKILLGFIIALAVLLLTSLLAYRSIQQLAFYTRQVEHTYQVLQYTSQLRTKVRDAQTAVRAYLLLADTTRLAEYRTNLEGTSRDFDSLQLLTRDNPVQQNRLDTLRRLVAYEKQVLKKWSTVNPTPYAARDLLLADQPTLEKLRKIVSDMTATETVLLRERSLNQDFYENTTPIAIVGSAVLAILIVLWLFSKITRELQANERLQQELAQVNQDTARRIAIIEQLADRVVQGDYSVKISNGAQQDSLGNLATSLNHMTQTLEETFAALQNRNKELDQFAYVASHDLKAPVRGVLTVLKWIEDELPHELSAQMRQYLDMMKGRLIRLEDLINGILAYARVGRTEQKLEEVRVEQLVREVAELVVPPAFQVEIPTTMPTFVTDRLSLQQVFTNLMSNAAKYHDKATGTITVSCQDIGRCYEFRVQDDGPGIAPEYHEKIFLIFQTLRDRNTAESTGIGLSIVKKMIDEKKGSIRVESAVGQGAAFVFTWPKAAVPELPAATL